jgi:hypothetical protein
MSVINNHGLTAKLSGAAGKPCHEAKCTTRVRLSAGLGGRVRDIAIGISMTSAQIEREFIRGMYRIESLDFVGPMRPELRVE